MRTFILSACLAMLLSGCITAGEVTDDSDPAAVRPHYKRPNLLVADLERSLEIYVDVLGFESSDIGMSGADSFSYPVFKIDRDATMRYTYLGEPGEARVFGLTEVSGMAMQPVSSSPHRTGHVIGVKDLDDKVARLARMGLGLTETRMAGGAEFTFREVAFTDYDGHLIVLYEVVE